MVRSTKDHGPGSSIIIGQHWNPRWAKSANHNMRYVIPIKQKGTSIRLLMLVKLILRRYIIYKSGYDIESHVMRYA